MAIGILGNHNLASALKVGFNWVECFLLSHCFDLCFSCILDVLVKFALLFSSSSCSSGSSKGG